MKKKNTTLAAFIVGVMSICLVGCLGVGLAVRFSPELYKNYLNNSSLKVGDPAPDFELISLDGETMSLSQFKGRPILLSIGATWCPDCRIEAPLLQELHETYPQLAVLLIDSKESPEIIQAYADEFGLTHPILLDRDGAVMELYQVFAIPTELFIDADGIVQAKLIERVTPELLLEKLPLIGISPYTQFQSTIHP
ncbi:MAG: TlpA family protein disulfide reductase [Anaerolineales bacterium]|jgi:peroxiredoxin|nr:TlpA family protein disulfide reductase [Chloroflexota bacterium]MBK6644662.1 TlpA family protein disulfide reductase [Anaerolineales bacterium]